MERQNFIVRIILFVMGLFIIALGVALSVKANLGVSPISCVPYIYSVRYPVSMGTTTIILNVLLILLQILVQRKNYQPIQLVQLPVVLVFGFFTDFTLFLVSDLTVTAYVWQMALCLVSCAVIAFGVFLEVKANVTFLAGEGLALALSGTFDMEFGKAKISVDSSLVIIGVASSLVLFHSLLGVREGTVFAALMVGFMVRIYSRYLPFFDQWISSHGPGKDPDELIFEKENAASHLIITISREFGSGGHEIGKRIAQELKLPFYDKELIRLSAEKGGFTTEYIKENEQRLSNTLLYRLYEQNYAYVNEQMPPLDALFLVQSKVIRDICRKGPCVIVGRCANFILKNNPGCFNVFIHASPPFRKERAVTRYGIKNADPDGVIEKIDRDRENYCSHYTGKPWQSPGSYHLTIDTSRVGIEAAARLIIQAVESG